MKNYVKMSSFGGDAFKPFLKSGLKKGVFSKIASEAQARDIEAAAQSASDGAGRDFGFGAFGQNSFAADADGRDVFREIEAIVEKLSATDVEAASDAARMFTKQAGTVGSAQEDVANQTTVKSSDIDALAGDTFVFDEGADAGMSDQSAHAAGCLCASCQDETDACGGAAPHDHGMFGSLNLSNQGTAYIFENLITADDATVYNGVRYDGTGREVMFDRRTNSFNESNVFVFTATFHEGNTVTFFVNQELGSREAAQRQVDIIAKSIGQTPFFMIEDLKEVNVQAGSGAFGGTSYDKTMLVHADSLAQAVSRGWVEEVMLHELAHIVVEEGLKDSQKWRDAQQADGAFSSRYAEDNPIREDVAETLVPWMASRIYSDRVADKARLKEFEDGLANRFKVLDELNYDLSSASRPDGQGNGAPTTNAAPTANDDTYSYTETADGRYYDRQNLLQNDSDPDGDALTVTQVNGQDIGGGGFIDLERGQIYVNQDGRIAFNARGEFDYLSAGQTEVIDFTYTVSDGNGGTATATARIEVTGEGGNAAPTANGETYVFTETADARYYDRKNLLANDSDPDGDALTVTQVNGQNIGDGAWIALERGQVYVNQDGRMAFDAEDDFEFLNNGETGMAEFDYTVSDGNGGTAVATARIEVTGEGSPDSNADNPFAFWGFGGFDFG